MGHLKILDTNENSELYGYILIHDAKQEISGASLLNLVVYCNKQSFVTRLLEMGANQNHKDSIRSILSIACYFGFIDIARLLIEYDTRIDVSCIERTYQGWHNHIQIETLNLLQDYGFINLYLDDLRDVPEGFVGARTVEEAISLMENNSINTLSLDHDLGIDDEGNLRKTGYDFVKYVCEKGMRPANRVYLHTDNVVGKENMYQTLLAAQRRGFIDTDIEIFPYPFTRNRFSG